jgi:hypothetical protein
MQEKSWVNGLDHEREVINMNTKSVIRKENHFNVLEEQKVDVIELFQLINRKWTGRVKTIIHAPTTAGLNMKIKTIADYQLKCGGGQIWIESPDQVFVITELTSVRYEEMAGRPNLQANCNGVVVEFYFI